MAPEGRIFTKTQVSTPYTDIRSVNILPDITNSFNNYIIFTHEVNRLGFHRSFPCRLFNGRLFAANSKYI